MMQEFVNLCMSDIGRLLGTLGLLSVGITLSLWGLKRRRRGAVVIALLLCLAALVPTVLAVEIPPMGSVAYIQTSGPNTALGIGDWYTNSGTTGPGYHSFDIYIPCIVLPTQVITIELFDPESNDTGAGDLDEERGGADDATFTLLAPDGVTVVATNTYPPGGGTSGIWNNFTNFTLGTYGCGIYTLRVSTSDNDDNAWRLRVEPDDPDGTPGTGDEISLGNLQTTFQNLDYACQVFYFFVPATSSIRLNNFDLDVPGFCDPLVCTVVYTTPSGVTIPGTESAGSEWNNGGGAGYPPPGGDVITDPESGWWQAALCMNSNNQYLFDADEQVYFYDKPATPDMIVSKDDGTVTFYPDGVLTYTITYTNAGPGAALYAVLTDTLPLSTTFVSCSGGLSCGYIPPPPDSGIVTFSLGTIIAGASDSVTVSVHVDPGAPTGTITNIVWLDYSDIVFSDYPVEADDDVDRYEESPTPETSTPESPTPETPTPETPTPETSTPDPPTPETSTPDPPTPETPTPETPTSEPPEPEAPEPEPPTPTFTLTPISIPISPTPLTATLVAEILSVETLPETGGFPGWFTVVLGVPIVIGAVGLLNRALSEVKVRRGDGD